MATAIDPTPFQVAEWKVLDDLFKWALMEGADNLEDLTKPAGAFQAHLGVTPDMTTTAIRLVGAIAEADLRAIISKWQIDGSAPTPMQASQAELVGRATRIACGAKKTKAQEARVMLRN